VSDEADRTSAGRLF